MLPVRIRKNMEALIITKIYNSRTGSSITHHVVEDWGFVEALEIISALEFMDEL